jgi:hypothetical protein
VRQAGKQVVKHGDTIADAMKGGEKVLKEGVEQVAKHAAEDVAGKSSKKIRVEATEAMERGRKSEGRVLDEMGESKNTTIHSTSHGDTIPDFENAKQVGDIKETKRVADTKQMKAQREVAEQSGREHVVVTGEKTKVTKPMENSGSRIARRPDLGPQDTP